MRSGGVLLLLAVQILELFHARSDPLADLLSACQEEHAALLSETDAAEARGVPVYLERSTLHSTQFYAAVALSDNATHQQELIRQQYEAFYARLPAAEADALAASLPVREANDTLQALTSARSVLASATAASRPALPAQASSGLRDAAVCDGYFCNAHDVPVFGVGINTWAKNGTPQFDPSAASFTLTTVGFSARYLREDLTFPQNLLARAQGVLDAAVSTNQTVHVLMGQAMPDWAEAKWPGLNTGNFTQHGVDFDIDNPGFPIVTSAAIKAFLDAHGCHPALGGWIMANEPSFTVSATPYTMNKWRAWLAERYRNNIGALNSAWSTAYGSFDTIAQQPGTPDRLEAVLLGGLAAQWWDWNNFNNARVTQFFQTIRDEIDAWRGGATTPGCRATTIKLQGGNEFCVHAGKGINRTALVALQSINGNDERVLPTSAINQRNLPNTRPSVAGLGYNFSQYLSDWLQLGASYTLQRSVNFSKPVYNTEWHGISTLALRDEHYKPATVALAVWLGLYHGEASNVAWYMPRNGVMPDKPNSFPGSFPGSLGTLPAATDAFLRTFLLARAHSARVAAVGRVRPRVWLLRSWSTFALNANATTTLLGAFHAASFLPRGVGFVFEEQLGRYVQPSDVVLVAGASHCEDATLAWLRHKAQEQADTVVLVRDPQAGAAAALLRFTPSGVARAEEELAFLAKLPSVSLRSGPAATQALAALPAVAALKASAPVRCVAADGSSASEAPPAFGVLCKAASGDSRLTALVLNPQVAPAEVQLASPAGEMFNATDLLTGRAVNPLVVKLAPGEVLLLDLTLAARAADARARAATTSPVVQTFLV